MPDLWEMAQAARPSDDDDWGTERQIQAENTFFYAVMAILTPEEWDDLEAYALKASVDETVDEAMRIMGL